MREDAAENLDCIKDICSHLTIEVDEENSEVLLFDDDQLGAICECATIGILFRTKLRHCWRWDDFSLLKKIIQKVGCPVCELLLKQYEQKLDSIMKLHEVYNFCKMENRDLPKGYEEMILILSDKLFYNITKQEYDRIKEFTSKHCGVKSYVLLPLKRVSSSSLLIVWSIPSTAVSYMIEMATENIYNFIKNSCVYFKISSTVIIDQRLCDVSYM